MSPLRVLLIANTLPPHDISGVGEQVLQLASGLELRGHEVRILGRGPNGANGARGPKFLFPLTVVPACRRALAEFRPDVVQVHESDGAFALLWTRWSRRRSGKGPLLVALLQVSYVEERRAVRELIHAGSILGAPGRVERRFRRFKAPLQILLGRWTSRWADLVLAPSAATVAELRRDYGVARAEVLPNVTGGIEVASVEPPAADPGTGELLFVGRLRIRKGVEVLLAAIAELRLRGWRGRLVLAGDGEHRGALESRARELGLGPESVVFLGRATAGQVRALLASARALVVPSIYEGMPLVILEAMAAGVPVVASAVSGIPEVVVDGETGWLVPCEDPPQLARALGEVLADETETRRRGAAGRGRVDALFRPEVAAELWQRLIEAARERRR